MKNTKSSSGVNSAALTLFTALSMTAIGCNDEASPDDGEQTSGATENLDVESEFEDAEAVEEVEADVEMPFDVEAAIVVEPRQVGLVTLSGGTTIKFLSYDDTPDPGGVSVMELSSASHASVLSELGTDLNPLEIYLELTTEAAPVPRALVEDAERNNYAVDTRLAARQIVDDAGEVESDYKAQVLYTSLCARTQTAASAFKNGACIFPSEPDPLCKWGWGSSQWLHTGKVFHQPRGNHRVREQRSVVLSCPTTQVTGDAHVLHAWFGSSSTPFVSHYRVPSNHMMHLIDSRSTSRHRYTTVEGQPVTGSSARSGYRAYMYWLD